MATFPAGIKTFATLVDNVNEVLATHPNERGDEITAIETAMGTTGNFNFLPIDASQFLTKDSLVLSAYDSVTSALGVGAKIDFLANNNAGTSRQFGQIRVETTGVAAAAEAGDLILSKSAAGSLVDIISIGASEVEITDNVLISGVDARLRLEGSGDPGSSYTDFDDAPTVLTIDKVSGAGNAFIDVNPMPADGESNANVRVFRFTNTTGGKRMRLFKGDDTGTVHVQLGVDGDDSYFDEGGNFGVGTPSPTARAHIVQEDSSGAKPVLLLEQVDVSEEMVEFVSTIGTGNAIEAVGAKTLTVTHFIKVTLPGGLTRYLEVGTIA